MRALGAGRVTAGKAAPVKGTVQHTTAAVVLGCSVALWYGLTEGSAAPRRHLARVASRIGNWWGPAAAVHLTASLPPVSPLTHTGLCYPPRAHTRKRIGLFRGSCPSTPCFSHVPVLPSPTATSCPNPHRTAGACWYPPAPTSPPPSASGSWPSTPWASRPPTWTAAGWRRWSRG